MNEKNAAFLLRRVLSVCFALFVWKATSLLVGNGLLLASPEETLLTLFGLIKSVRFWHTVAFSSLRITGGFACAFAVGAILAFFAGALRIAEDIFKPFMTAVRAAPVASFIILCIIGLGSKRLSTVISFLTVLPVVYADLLEGIRARDEALSEMAEVFGISGAKRFLWIELPRLRPYIVSALTSGAGLAWKSGTAAEVIGITSGSIGERLYMAKVGLSTGELFTWTIVIILCSLTLEKLVRLALCLIFDRMEASL